MPPGMIYSETSHLVSGQLLCVLTLLFLVCTSDVLTSSSRNDTSHIRLGSVLMTSPHLLKDSVSKYNQMGVVVKTSAWVWWGHIRSVTGIHPHKLTAVSEMSKCVCSPFTEPQLQARHMSYMKPTSQCGRNRQEMSAQISLAYFTTW